MVASQKKYWSQLICFSALLLSFKSYFAFLWMEFIEIAGNTWSPHCFSPEELSHLLSFETVDSEGSVYISEYGAIQSRGRKRRFLLSTSRACALLTRYFVNIYSFLYTRSLPSPIRWGNIIVTISQMEEVNADRSGDSPATTEADLELRR